MEYEVFAPDEDEFYDRAAETAWSQMWNGGYYASQIPESDFCNSDGG